MFRIFVVLMLSISILLGNATSSYAASNSFMNIKGNRDDDSCIPRRDFNRILSILTTVGIYYWISRDFKMVDHENTDDYETDDGEGGGTCSIPIEEDGFLKYTYSTSFFGLFTLHRSKQQLKHGDHKVQGAGFVHVRGRNIGDMLCAQVLLPLGWTTIGCKYRQAPGSVEDPSAAACYVKKDLCKVPNPGLRGTKSFLPITTTVIQCVKEALNAFFLPIDVGCKTLFNQFQNNMRNIVMILLTMYVALFGIRVALVREINKGEVFTFIMKMILVVYFSVGFKTATGEIRHGVNDVYTFFVSAATELSQIAVTAGGADTGPCKYAPSEYTAKESKFLMGWDLIDCRIVHYLGINNIKGMALIGGLASLISLFIGPAILVVLVLFILYAALFIGIIVHVVHSFLISLVAITIITFLAPIFVPMALFNATKRMYEGWFKTLIANVIQPVVLMTFLSFMFGMMDEVVAPGCVWERQPVRVLGIDSVIKKVTGKSNTENLYTWKITKADGDCKNSLGYNLQQPGINFTTLKNIMTGLLSCIMYMFLFFFFVGMADSISADLSGSPSMGANMAIGGRDMASAVMGKMQSAMSMAKGGSSSPGGKSRRNDGNARKESGDGNDKGNGGDDKRGGDKGGAEEAKREDAVKESGTGNKEGS